MSEPLPSIRTLPEREVDIPGPERLVGRLALPEGAKGLVLLCHPHPLHGGSLENKIMVLAARALFGWGWGWLRFNFRGVGHSTGHYDEGNGEVDDVHAALSYLRQAGPGLPIAVLGYSFGSVMAARALLTEPDVLAYIGIGPPVGGLLDCSALPLLRLPVLLIAGSRDEFAPEAALRQMASSLTNGQLVILPDTDHYFIGAGRDLLRPIGPFLDEALRAG